LTQHIRRHFRDNHPSQSLDWCKKPVFLTNHLAGTCKTIITTNKWQHVPKQQLTLLLLICVSWTLTGQPGTINNIRIYNVRISKIQHI